MIPALESGEYAFVVVNYSNGDMVGHTAARDDILKAVHTLDGEVNRLLESAAAPGFSVLRSANHGNCAMAAGCPTSPPPCQNPWDWISPPR